MKIIGQLALILWLVLIVGAVVSNLAKGSAYYRFVRNNQRRLVLASILLLITWVMLLGISGLFSAG